MGKLTDYIDRWRTATPVRLPEIEIEYIPLYPKEQVEAELGTKVTKFVSEGNTFAEVPTFESLLEKLESMIEDMKK